MSVYEHNFQRLVKLLPELFSQEQELAPIGDDVRLLKVDILERHKYTTVIKLAQELPLSLSSVAFPAMTVRVYHDAQVAEVLSYQGHFRFSPKYDYPNPQMCQVREKQRVNDFLGEWLDFCLAGQFGVKPAALI